MRRFTFDPVGFEPPSAGEAAQDRIDSAAVRVSGPDPEHCSYPPVSFSDPDGNGCLLQEPD